MINAPFVETPSSRPANLSFISSTGSSSYTESSPGSSTPSNETYSGPSHYRPIHHGMPPPHGIPPPHAPMQGRGRGYMRNIKLNLYFFNASNLTNYIL
jgi:hypothetical protein